MTTASLESSVSANVDRSALPQAQSFAAMMVHLDVERDCEQRVQLSLALADRFEATLIGVAGLPLRPAFAGGGVVVYREPSEEHCRAVSARLDEMGRRFRAKGQRLKQVEWRAALELPYELVSREARAADLIIVGTQDGGGSAHELVDPGAILLRAGRPILVAPATATRRPSQRCMSMIAITVCFAVWTRVSASRSKRTVGTPILMGSLISVETHKRSPAGQSGPGHPIKPALRRGVRPSSRPSADGICS